MTDDDRTTLLSAMELLTLDLVDRTMSVDWSDGDEVAAADKVMRVLSAFGRNIEKCLAMTKSDGHPPASKEQHDIDQLRSDMERRLARYADRLGREELAERLRSRGDHQSAERLVVLGKAGSTSPQD